MLRSIVSACFSVAFLADFRFSWMEASVEQIRHKTLADSVEMDVVGDSMLHEANGCTGRLHWSHFVSVSQVF